MHEIKLKAHAKINLGLDVLRKREDGYHDLRMVMQTVRLHDRILLKKTRAAGIRVKTNLGFLPADESNLAYRAAALLMEEFGIGDGVFITLEKHIPVAAGLAGGSADAAAVLVGVNRMFSLGLSMQQLMDRGVRIGADVPYCVMRGTALAEGIGEKLTRLEKPVDCTVLLAKPPVHVSTKFVYSNLKLNEQTVHPDIDGQILALQEGDFASLAAKMGNVLETVTVPAYPVIAQIRDMMLEGGAAGAMMSGSGPTVFGLFEKEDEAKMVSERLAGSGLAKLVCLTGFYHPRTSGEQP